MKELFETIIILLFLALIIFLGALIIEIHQFRAEYKASQTTESLAYASNKMICYRREK